MPQLPEPPKAASSGHWKWIVSIALAAALLYFSLRGVEWGRVWTLIAGAHWQYFVGSALIVCVSSVLRALRWRVLLNAEANLGVWTVFRATMAGYLGNNFLPARAGEVIRTLLISRRSNLSKTYVLTTALSERLMDVIALVLASSIVLMGVHPKPAWMADLSRSMAIVAALGALTVTVVPHTGNLLTKLLARLPLPAGLHEKLVVTLGAGAARHARLPSLGPLRRIRRPYRRHLDVRRIIRDGGLARAGSESDVLSRYAALTGLGLGSALPSTPGYVGIYQFVAVSVLVPFGVSKDAALAYILITQAVGYIVVLLLGSSVVLIAAGSIFRNAWPRWLTASFLLFGSFAKSGLEGRVVKQRVITEAAGATRCIEHLAFHRAFVKPRTSPCSTSAITHTNRALRLLDAAQSLEQEPIVVFIGGVWTGKARGVDSGRAIECVNHQSRIVGKDRTGCVRRVMTRFENRVLGKSDAVFHALGNLSEVGQAVDFDSRLGCGAPELAKLARVAGGAPQLHAPIAFFCSSPNSAMPCLASATKCDIWDSSNGACSAVPCTSMNLPPPVMTMFISTSARESSS